MQSVGHLRSWKKKLLRQERAEKRKKGYALGRKIVRKLVYKDAFVDEEKKETVCMTTEREAYNTVKPVLDSLDLPFVSTVTRNVEPALVIETAYKDGAWQNPWLLQLKYVRR